MNYGIFKGGRFLGQDKEEDGRSRRRAANEQKKPRKRLGCAIFLLPLLVLILYLVIKSRL